MYPSSNSLEPIGCLCTLFSRRTALTQPKLAHIAAREAVCLSFDLISRRHLFIYLFMIEYKWFVCRQIRKWCRTCSISTVCPSVYWPEVYAVQRTSSQPLYWWWVCVRSCHPNRSVGLCKPSRIYKWLPKCFRAAVHRSSPTMRANELYTIKMRNYMSAFFCQESSGRGETEWNSM